MASTEYPLFKVSNTNKKFIHTYTRTCVYGGVYVQGSQEPYTRTIGPVSFGDRDLSGLYFAFYIFLYLKLLH